MWELSAAASALVAAGGVGWLSGSLTAETGHHPHVISAVVPVVITALGALLGARLGRGKSKSTIVASLFVLSFCLFFFEGSNRATSERVRAVPLVAEEELRITAEYRKRYLQWCSETEYRINMERGLLGLAPLSSKDVCDDL